MVIFTFVLFILFSVINLSVLQLYFILPETPYSKEYIDTEFYLHTIKDPNVNEDCRLSAYNITSIKESSFDPEKETKFIVHGYYQNGQRQWLKEMAAAFLEKGDYNILRVDWGKGSFPGFDIALANTKVVGKEIAFFIQTLVDNFSFDPMKAHCIGHSMGSFVCGYTGLFVKNFGRITGLDQGPREVFEVSENETLDPSDANFVDVIHTDIKMTEPYPYLGEPNPLGHIDIYINGGYDQTGCEITLETVLDPGDKDEEILLDLIINEMFCSHFKSIYVYIESIKMSSTCQFVAYKCSSYEDFQKGDCASCGDDDSKCAILGPSADEYTDKTSERVKFYINTGPKVPFCVEHYVVAVSTDIIMQDQSPSFGVLTFEIIGDKGSFKDQFQINETNHGQIVKMLFVNGTDVGKISSVNLTWKCQYYLLGIIKTNCSYIIRVKYIKVSPLSHYPESERKMFEVVACLTSDGTSTQIKTQETKNFPVMTNCVV